MSPIPVSGTEGYAEEADAFTRKAEGVSFANLHGEILHLIPPAPCRILDIGAGSGRDAAAFAAMGHAIVAVEPTDGLRRRAAALHPSPRIEWLDDSLPELAGLTKRGESFDVVMMTAVWMHLDETQRQRAMPVIAALLRSGGIMSLTLRHGPVPPGRRMFNVQGDETMTLASNADLDLVLRLDGLTSLLGTPEVTWTRLAFVKRA